MLCILVDVVYSSEMMFVVLLWVHIHAEQAEELRMEEIKPTAFLECLPNSPLTQLRSEVGSSIWCFETGS